MIRPLALLLLLAAPAFGQVAALNGPARVEPGGLILLSPAGTESDDPPSIVAVAGQDAALVPIPLYTPDGKGGFTPFGAMVAAPSVPGVYTFACVATKRQDDGPPLHAVATFSVQVGNRPPPEPDPDPRPPPDPDPVPTVDGVHRVIIAYESKAATTHRLIDVLNSVPLRQYLDQITGKDATGRGLYRFWDRDVTLSAIEPPEWHEAWAKIQADVTEAPRVFAFDQSGNVVSFPLPDTVEAAIAELQKIEGR